MQKVKEKIERQDDYRDFLISLLIETIINLIAPTFYGLFFFEIWGYKEGQHFDCYANSYSDFATTNY